MNGKTVDDFARQINYRSLFKDNNAKIQELDKKYDKYSKIH